MPKLLKMCPFLPVRRNETDPRVQITHLPTGTVATAHHRDLGHAKHLAMRLLRSKLAAGPAPTRRVRNYDLTPGIMRIRGTGIDTTDPARIYRILDGGELPGPNR